MKNLPLKTSRDWDCWIQEGKRGAASERSPRQHLCSVSMRPDMMLPKHAEMNNKLLRIDSKFLGDSRK